MKLSSGAELAGRWWRASSALRPVLFLHGLLGSHRNMAGLAQAIAAERSALSVDLRNHGASSHSSANGISDHVADVGALLEEHMGGPAHIVGHSFGGRVAMQTALRFPERVASLFVLDISPDKWTAERVRRSQVYHILEGLAAIRLERGQKEVAEELKRVSEGDAGLFGFLRTNLVEASDGKLSWRCNLDVIHRSYIPNCAFEFSQGSFPGAPTVAFARQSNFVDADGFAAFARHFPAFDVRHHAHAVDAGHWLHGERPAEVLQLLRDHLRAAES